MQRGVLVGSSTAPIRCARSGPCTVTRCMDPSWALQVCSYSLPSSVEFLFYFNVYSMFTLDVWMSGWPVPVCLIILAAFNLTLQAGETIPYQGKETGDLERCGWDGQPPIYTDGILPTAFQYGRHNAFWLCERTSKDKQIAHVRYYGAG